MSEIIKCTFCGENAESERYPVSSYRVVTCPVCGNFIQQYSPFEYGVASINEFAAYLYHKNINFTNDNKFIFLGNKEKYENNFLSDERVIYVSYDEVMAFYPKNISERLHKVLIALATMSDYVGKKIHLSKKQLYSLLFVKLTDKTGTFLRSEYVYEQMLAFLHYLADQNYIKYSSSGTGMHYIELKPQGWHRVDELQNDSTEFSKDVFIAMSFAENMKGVRDAIKTAVTECGFNPRIMDEIEHNHQIVPEMLYEIRQARFVIAELTGHNNGAYFEAGYALGHGKEVIQVCNKEKFGEDGHFDVKQINTVMWENEEELTEKLIARIKATVG